MPIVAPELAADLELVTLEDYEQVTGDTTTSEADAAQAILDAIDLAEGRLGRKLRLDTYTELLRPDSRGRLWPTATPLVSVSVPVGATIRGVSIIGAGGWWGPDYRIAGGPGEPPYETSVTYVGGFTHDTLPERLRRAIGLLAWQLVHPATDPTTLTETTVSNILANASSIRVGDVAVSGSSSSGGQSGTSTSVTAGSSLSLSAQISAYLAPFRRRHLVP